MVDDQLEGKGVVGIDQERQLLGLCPAPELRGCHCAQLSQIRRQLCRFRPQRGVVNAAVVAAWLPLHVRGKHARETPVAVIETQGRLCQQQQGNNCSQYRPRHARPPRRQRW